MATSEDRTDVIPRYLTTRAADLRAVPLRKAAGKASEPEPEASLSAFGSMI